MNDLLVVLLEIQAQNSRIPAVVGARNWQGRSFGVHLCNRRANPANVRQRWRELLI